MCTRLCARYSVGNPMRKPPVFLSSEFNQPDLNAHPLCIALFLVEADWCGLLIGFTSLLASLLLSCRAASCSSPSAAARAFSGGRRAIGGGGRRG